MDLAARARKTLAAAGTIWSIVGISLLLLVGLELAASAYYRIMSSSSDRRWERDAFRNAPWVRDFAVEDGQAAALEWHPYVYWRHKPFSGRFINVDAKGIRATWQPPRAQGERPIRVFMLGGSTMWGTGSPDDATIASLLAKKLAEARPGGRPVEITNFGEHGYVTTQELLTLELELRRGNVPDAVVFYDGVNDTGAGFQEGAAGIPQSETHRKTDFENPVTAFVQGLIRESALLRPILWRMRERVWRGEDARRSAEERDKLAGDVVHLYEANLGIVEGLARDYGFRSLFFWQPVIFTKRHLTPDEQQAAADNGFMRDFFQQTWGLMRQSPHLAANPDFHDLSGIFDAVEDPLYFDFVHVTEPGNQRVADAMLPFAVALLDSLPERPAADASQGAPAESGSAASGVKPPRAN